jgi:L,D-peptidoglycan transpeptidase YkuD (ErfK/YbiS/YcfS/YnhG family)
MVLTPRGLRFRGRRLACAIGRGGLTRDKREGDGATPVGLHRVTGLLYRPDRVSSPAPWALPIRPGDLWSDDGSDPRYNHLVRAPHPFSHEALRRADRLYDLVLLTNWNWPEAVPGRGSAIFLHRWRKPGHPTEGCLAFSPADLFWLSRHAPPGTRLLVPPLPGR